MRKANPNQLTLQFTARWRLRTFSAVVGQARLLCICPILVFIACGGGGGDSGAPSNQAPLARILPSEITAVVDGQAVTFEGEGSDPEDGQLSDSNLEWTSDIDGALGEGATISAVLSVGDHTISLTVRDTQGESNRAVISLLVLSANDVVETLWLGAGPLAPPITAFCPSPGRASGFPKGTAISLVISNTVSAQQRGAIESNLDKVAELSNGELMVTVVTTDDPNPIPLANQVTVTAGTPPQELSCRAEGCTIPEFSSPGVLKSSRVVLPVSQLPEAFAHDAIGHGIFGLCHIDGNRIGDTKNSLMSFGDGVRSSDISSALTDIDAFAISLYYSSGLPPGSNRQAFINAGLVRGY